MQNRRMHGSGATQVTIHVKKSSKWLLDSDPGRWGKSGDARKKPRGRHLKQGPLACLTYSKAEDRNRRFNFEPKKDPTFWRHLEHLEVRIELQ